MSDHDKSNPRNPLYAIVRNISMIIDGVAFGLLDVVYRLFFRVTTLDIISNEVILKFYGRIQLIIGVFMMFQLTLIILKGIMNPDSFMDSKTGGFNLITRISLALVMFALIIPINIENPQNEYQKQINNNGLLFGTLYSLQYRLLKNNTVGRLVLGTDATTSTDPDDSSRLTSASRIFTSTIVKTFYRINLKDDVTEAEDGTTPDANESNWMCKASEWHSEEYQKADVNPESVIEMGMSDTCTVGGKERYAIAYSGFISFIAGFFFVFLFLSFTIEVAIRAIKLAILRLIAPIPIISYMDPKGSKDGAFNAWVKTLTTTYLDLFIRLAVIHFVLYVIEGLIKGGIVMGDGRVRALATIIIIAGLLIFAKDAPKFFKQALGMKDEPFKLFGGLGEIAGAISGIGSARVSARASRDADMARYRGQGMTEADATRAARSLGNRGKHLLAGMAGGIIGAGTGISAAAGAKDHQVKAALDAVAKRNAKVAAAGRDGGTFFGGLGAYGQKAVTGETQADALELDFKRREAEIKNEQTALKTRQDALKTEQANNAHRKSIMDRSKSKAADSTDTSGTYKGITANYRDYHSAYTAAVNNGTGVHTQYRAADGSTITNAEFEGMDAAHQAQYVQESWFDYNGQRIKMAEAQSIDMGLLDANQANYYDKAVQFERDVANGMSEADAITAGGIKDDAILADREAYRTATAQDLEDHFGGGTGLKASFGRHANENGAESDAISRISQDLSERSQQISEDRRAFPAERAAANASRFDGK